MKDQLDYEFNRKKIDESLRLLRDCCYGFKTPLHEYVSGADGELSDAKIEKLTGDLLDAARSQDLRYKYYGMEGATVRFIRLYIYLAIRAYSGQAINFGDLLTLLEGMKGNYASLDELVLRENGFQPVRDEEEEQYVGEYIRYPAAAIGFFKNLDVSYRILAGHDITEEFTDEELMRIWEREEGRRRLVEEERRRREARLGEKYGNLALEPLFPGDADYNFDLEVSYGMNPDEYWSMQYEYWSKQDDMDAQEETASPMQEDTGEGDTDSEGEEKDEAGNVSEGNANGETDAGAGIEDEGNTEGEIRGDEEDKRVPFPDAEREKQRDDERRQREHRWIGSFDKPEKFLDAYREFRGLFFGMNLDEILYGLREGIIYFLVNEGKSALADNEEFLRLYIQLDRAYRRIGKR